MSRVTLDRIEAQIQELRLQEEAARTTLSQPDCKPSLRNPLARLLEQTVKEQARLQNKLREAAHYGRENFGWNELST